MSEHVPTLAELQTELSMLENPNDEELRKIRFIGVPVSERIAEVHRRMLWRQSRQSSPKCLRCGSTSITLLPHANEFEHPHTGERVVVVVEHGFTDHAPYVVRFTTEGDRITKATSETLWFLI